MTTTPIAGAPDWAASQASPWLTENQASGWWKCRPACDCREPRERSPRIMRGRGSLYRRCPDPERGPANRKAAVAAGTNASNGWYFLTIAIEGMQIYVQDENATIEYDRASWVSAGGAVDASTILFGSIYETFYAANVETALDELFGITTALYAAIHAAQNYRIGLFFVATPSSSEVIMLHVATSDFTFPANFSTPTSKGSVGTNPTLSFALDVMRNGASIGTITIGTGGAFTFATAGGVAIGIAIGDTLKIVAPASADATIANVAITLVGTLS